MEDLHVNALKAIGECLTTPPSDMRALCTFLEVSSNLLHHYSTCVYIFLLFGRSGAGIPYLVVHHRSISKPRYLWWFEIHNAVNYLHRSVGTFRWRYKGWCGRLSQWDYKNHSTEFTLWRWNHDVYLQIDCWNIQRFEFDIYKVL